MNFLQFKTTFQGHPAFSRPEIEKHFPGFDAKNLLRWQAKGYLQKIRNNWYCFTDRPWEQEQLYWIANRLYAPSYISLEAALSHYGLIPEAVFTLQSVSTRKTAAFQTPIGHFIYANVKPSWFFGYRMQKTGNLYAAIADPAKALLDLLYLRPELQTEDQFNALRLNLAELSMLLDVAQYRQYVQEFAGPVLRQRARRLLTFIQSNLTHAVSG